MTSEDYSGLKIKDMMKKIGVLNIYILNIYHVISFMLKSKKQHKTRSV